MLFSGSAWTFVCLLIIVLLAPIGKPVVGNQIWLSLLFAIGAVGMLAMLIIMIGMAIHCVFLDRSSAGAKVLWFLSFLLTGPFGSVVYFSKVYRKQVAAHKGEANA
jgi:multisubunit Na+/H+ antiporter MnhG subunit